MIGRREDEAGLVGNEERTMGVCGAVQSTEYSTLIPNSFIFVCMRVETVVSECPEEKTIKDYQLRWTV